MSIDTDIQHKERTERIEAMLKTFIAAFDLPEKMLDDLRPPQPSRECAEKIMEALYPTEDDDFAKIHKLMKDWDVVKEKKDLIAAIIEGQQQLDIRKAACLYSDKQVDCINYDANIALKAENARLKKAIGDVLNYEWTGMTTGSHMVQVYKKILRAALSDEGEVDDD
ncbi:MAG: hypothetical protein KAR42_17675 [candidate division Zixibacteria bacterium]|nr:hypothetical protein [candidate division Zixibacteria bacterium]